MKKSLQFVEIFGITLIFGSECTLGGADILDVFDDLCFAFF